MTHASGAVRGRLGRDLDDLRARALFKEERIIAGPQGASVRLADGREVLNFCANNYLGLANHPAIIEAARAALDDHGFGMASVRFICGTQDLHKELERAIARFLACDDAILFSSCFDANGGVFEALLGEEDAVISDALNHASIIDGIRLCKAKRLRYAHAGMADLTRCLAEAKGARTRLIVTDGVFSMDGDVAPLDRIVALAEEHDALVMIDDSHATGFYGPTGRGSAEHHGVLDRIDVFTSTLGKAMGGASGGFVAGRAEIVAMLRQRARPYLFSNTLPPPIAAAGIAAFGLVEEASAPRAALMANTRRFREAMTKAGFSIKPGDHPIVPVMLGEAELAQHMARDLLAEGIYAVGFFYPVVPQGQARVRVQLSADHTPEHIDRAVAAFTKVGRRLNVIR